MNRCATQGNLVSDASDYDHLVNSSSNHQHLPFPHSPTISRPDIGIPNWATTQASISRNTTSIPWEARIPSAFWKGNAQMSPSLRVPIVECNDDPLHRWHVESHHIEWDSERDKSTTKLENQCDYRWALCTVVSLQQDME